MSCAAAKGVVSLTLGLCGSDKRSVSSVVAAGGSVTNRRRVVGVAAVQVQVQVQCILAT